MKALVIVIIAALSGCVSLKSGFHPPLVNIEQNGKFSIQDPASKILVIYTPGAGDHTSVGRCDYENLASLPAVMRNLAGTRIAGKDVIVHGYCSGATGTFYGNNYGTSKPEVRAKDVEAVIREYIRQGVPPKSIFVAGHSMGGWTALIVARDRNVEIGGILAFAPALAWEKPLRYPNHHALQMNSVSYIAQATRIKGMVYAFDGDQFNTPEDLAFLQDIDGISFFSMSATDIGGKKCNSSKPHYVFFDECFYSTQMEAISAFIQNVVGET